MTTCCCCSFCLWRRHGHSMYRIQCQVLSMASARAHSSAPVGRGGSTPWVLGPHRVTRRQSRDDVLQHSVDAGTREKSARLASAASFCLPDVHQTSSQRHRQTSPSSAGEQLRSIDTHLHDLHAWLLCQPRVPNSRRLHLRSFCADQNLNSSSCHARHLRG